MVSRVIIRIQVNMIVTGRDTTVIAVWCVVIRRFIVVRRSIVVSVLFRGYQREIPEFKTEVEGISG